MHRAKDYTVVEMKGDILNLQLDSSFGFLATSNKVYIQFEIQLLQHPESFLATSNKVYWLNEATLNNATSARGLPVFILAVLSSYG